MTEVTETEIDKVCLVLEYPSKSSYDTLCLDLGRYIFHTSSSEEKIIENVNKFCHELVDNLDELSIKHHGKATSIKITVEEI